MAEPISDVVLAHYGIKGMKWGVRKDGKSQGFQYGKETRAHTNKHGIKVRDKSYTTTLKNGDKLILSGDKSPAMARMLARISPKIRESQMKYSSFTILDKHGKKIGTSSIAREGNTTLYLDWIHINEAHRSHGYGTAVIGAAVEAAKKEGIEHIYLDVPGISPDARHIYEKLGFKVTNQKTKNSNDIWGGLTTMELQVNR